MRLKWEMLNVGRVWVKDRFGLGAVGVAGYVLNRRTSASTGKVVSCVAVL